MVRRGAEDRRQRRSSELKVLFLGNHDVGIAALRRIAETEQVTGVVAHPPDPEDGVRYGSLHEYARAAGWPVIRARPSDPDFTRFVANANADLLWITDYRYL